MMHRMPTANPRLTITLQPSLAAQLRRMSELTGNSQSALISELLDGVGPVFDRLITVLEAASEARGALTGSLTQDLDDAQARIGSQLGLALEHFDEGTRPILDAAEAVRRRRAKGAPPAGTLRALGGVPTPISNRGVRLDPKTSKKPTATKTYAAVDRVRSRGGKSGPV